jgi:hypothetical protein
MRPTIVRWLGPLGAVALLSCDMPPGRTGSCQPATPLVIGTPQTGEAYHDDCTGPKEHGDFFTMSIASQANIEINIVPEGSFAPTFAVYRGSPGDVDPPPVARMVAAKNETLAVRLFLAPGNYFMIAGTATRVRAPYQIVANPSVGADCVLWNFVTKGVEIDGNVTTSDCEVLSGAIYRAESFEMWWAADDSVRITTIADFSGLFRMDESCCSFQVVFSGGFQGGDTLAWVRRAREARQEYKPHRRTVTRDVTVTGPGTYWMKIE